MCIGGSRGGAPETRAPLGVQILSFSCSFRQKNLQNNPNLGVVAPPRENPGSATDVHHIGKVYGPSGLVTENFQ